MSISQSQLKGCLRSMIRAGRAMEELGDASSSTPMRAVRTQVIGAAREAAKLLQAIEQRELFGEASPAAVGDAELRDPAALIV